MTERLHLALEIAAVAIFAAVMWVCERVGDLRMRWGRE